MTLWALILLLGLIKIPIVGLMLWLPFRGDERLTQAASAAGGAEDDGGSKAPPVGPQDPSPCAPPRKPSPRRGPHGSPAHPSPSRVRSPLLRAGQRSANPSRWRSC